MNVSMLLTVRTFVSLSLGHVKHLPPRLSGDQSVSRTVIDFLTVSRMFLLPTVILHKLLKPCEPPWGNPSINIDWSFLFIPWSIDLKKRSSTFLPGAHT